MKPPEIKGGRGRVGGAGEFWSGIFCGGWAFSKFWGDYPLRGPVSPTGTEYFLAYTLQHKQLSDWTGHEPRTT